MLAECPVCLELYNLKSRQPKTLVCRHNVCNECLEKLKRDDQMECPKCRQQSRFQNVCTNYGLTEVLEQYCRVCVREKHIGKCHHCHELLCKTCMDIHRTDSYTDLKKNVETMIKQGQNVNVKSANQTHLHTEFKNEEDISEQVKTLLQKQKDELDRLQAKLVQEIKQISAANVSKHKDWATSLGSQIDKCISFARTTQSKLGSSCSREHTTELLADLNREAEDLLSKLNEIQNDIPKVNQYFFLPPESTTLSVGKVVCEPARVADYTSVRSKAVAGKEGSGVSEFKNRAYVCGMDDRIVVAERDNHRVKVYDWELNLMCVIGEKGSNIYQFNYPSGVCSIGGEFYISDQRNHRIQVFNKEFKLMRVFGTKGSGNDQFDQPVGLAAGPGPLLYVCDARNYRVKVVRPDGGYVGSIGCQGTGPGEFSETPQKVAITSHGVVLVTDTKAANVYMFKSSGEYLRLLIDSIPHTTNLPRLTGITVDRHDNIIMADHNNHRLIVLDSEGQYKCQVGVAGVSRESWTVPVMSMSVGEGILLCLNGGIKGYKSLVCVCGKSV